MKPTTPQPDEPSSGESQNVVDSDSRTREIDFTELETPAELAPPKREVADTASGADDALPAIDRVRPVRPPLVPRVAWLVLALTAALLVLGAAGLVAVNRAALVRVPDVKGQDVGVATNLLAQVGLEGHVAERRFSARPQDEVLAQTPVGGSELPEGEVVELIVSAGTEELVMPDVVGDGLALAQGAIEARGLVIDIAQVPSDEVSGTVLSTTPAAGTIVRSGDVVRVEVATSLVGGATLQPYIMLGKTFVIDPGPSGSFKSDVTLDIARRVRGLLEAAQARVIVTRSGTSSSTTAEDRAKVAEDTSATAGVGVSLRTSGNGGRTVSGPLEPLTLRESARPLVKQLDLQLGESAPPSSTKPKSDEKVLTDVTYPWARVSIGSTSDADDKAAFADPEWLDRVAKAIYTALGEEYGVKE